VRAWNQPTDGYFQRAAGEPDSIHMYSLVGSEDLTSPILQQTMRCEKS
jgi:hypothetical protein